MATWLVEYRGMRSPWFALHFDSDISGKKPLLTASETRLAEERWMEVPGGMSLDDAVAYAVDRAKLKQMVRKYGNA